MHTAEAAIARIRRTYIVDSFLYKGRCTGLLRQWRTRSTLKKQREETMNTIQVTTQSGAVINYTEAEVIRFIEKAEQVDAAHRELQESYNKIRDIKNYVRDFFTEEEWQDGVQEVKRDDVNRMLEHIGARRIPVAYSATVTVTLNVTGFEADSEEDLHYDIENELEVSINQGDAEVYSVEVSGIEEE